jgi:hypothetical protein
MVILHNKIPNRYIFEGLEGMENVGILECLRPLGLLCGHLENIFPDKSGNPVPKLDIPANGFHHFMYR